MPVDLAFVNDLLASVQGVADPFVLAAILCISTALVGGFGVPGLLVPLSFSSGLLLDSVIGAPVVLLGLVLGSQGLFLAARRGATSRRFAGSRFAGYAAALERRSGRYGPLYAAGLRVVGTPHVVVTFGSAVAGLRQRDFALATLIGSAPAVALAAAAGAAI